MESISFFDDVDSLSNEERHLQDSAALPAPVVQPRLLADYYVEDLGREYNYEGMFEELRALPDELLDDGDHETVNEIQWSEIEKHVFAPCNEEFDWNAIEEEFTGFGKRKSQITRDNLKKIKNSATGNDLPTASWVSNESSSSYNKLFKRTQISTKFAFSHNFGRVNLLEMDEKIDECWNDFVTSHIHQANENDRITIQVHNDNPNKQLYFNFLKRNFNAQDFLNKIFSVVQSNDKFLEDGVLEVTINIIQNSTGSGFNPSKRAPRQFIDRAKQKRSVKVVSNLDNSCGYRAIILGKLLADLDFQRDHPEWKRFSNDSNNRWSSKVTELCNKWGCDINVPMDRAVVLPLIQENLSSYQIIVVDALTKTKLFCGPMASKRIFLEYTDEHYNLILSINGYMEKDFFCIKCWKGGRHREHHRCPDGCDMCRSAEKCNEIEKIYCQACNREFHSPSCLLSHFKNKICKKIKSCKTCGFNYSGVNHTCGQYFCSNCNAYYETTPHYCHIKPLSKIKLLKEDSDLKFIVAYDIEAAQETSNNGLLHKPILLVAKVTCTICENLITDVCDKCGIRDHEFYGLDCVQRFSDFLYQQLAVRAENLKARKVYVIAHNAKGYDGHFIIRDLYNRKFNQESVIMQGSKILMLEIGNVRFIDSLCFFFQALDKLPKSFGIQNTEKGFFPHKFNTVANQNYIGLMPEKEFFSPQQMKKDQLQNFEKWYNSSKTSVFHLHNEMIKYCKNDVKILMESTIRFRNLFKQVTGLDPITRRFTLASIGLEYFRTCILPESTLAITPIAPYGKPRNQSRKGNTWLDWCEESVGKIQREARIGIFYADGKKDNTVYEFFGCHWHGCQECYTDNRTEILQISNEETTRNEQYAKVESKRKYYTQIGLTLVEIWEHEYTELLKQTNFKTFALTRKVYYDKLENIGHLNIRDAFFGGRTNNLKFFYDCAEDEEIKYVDFTSLYPYVLSKYTYPVGHPEVIKDNFDYSLKNYFGFVKCKVFAPPSLQIPVLPVRIDGKLMFPLCVKCAEIKSQVTCEHTFEERSFIGTWTTLELNEALKYNYRIEEIYEVLHYPSTSQSDNLFKKYVQQWLKVKTEASGYPLSCDTNEGKQNFVQEFLDKEGVQLDCDNIARNEGLRFIAKLMLNSLWGKFAQRHNLRKTEIVRDYDSYWERLNDASIKITGENNPSDEAIYLEYEMVNESDCDPGNTNIAVSSYVTAYARLELFRLMMTIENTRYGSVLYHDTDSVIFVQKIGENIVELGNFLGELTDEILQDYGVGAKCFSFVSCGPKNYAYKVKLQNGEEKAVLKIKGITQTCEALDVIDFELMKTTATAYTENQQVETNIPQWNIHTNKWDHIVKTSYFMKKYRALSDKRRIVGVNTLPYGYIDL